MGAGAKQKSEQTPVDNTPENDEILSMAARRAAQSAPPAERGTACLAAIQRVLAEHHCTIRAIATPEPVGDGAKFLVSPSWFIVPLEQNDA